MLSFHIRSVVSYMEHTPYLTPQPQERGAVEKRVNFAYQTRPAPPTPYENRLGDALEKAFAAGIESLPDLVRALNADGVPDPAGKPWTEASFQAEMGRYA